MKNRHALDLVLAATLLSMTVLRVNIPFVRGIEWSSETPLTTHPSQDVSPAIMQAGNGTIWVVWVSNRMEFLNDELIYKTSSDYGLNWSLATRLTQASGYDSGPSIMQASNGSIWVAWASTRTGNYELFYKTFNGTAWFSDTQLTNNAASDTAPSIAQAMDGTIWVVWVSDRTGNLELFCKTYNGSNGSAWSTETQLTNDPSSDEDPSIVQARNGTIWVVWSSYRTGNYELFYKTFNGTSWSSYAQLTNDSDFDMAPSIAQARDGTIWVVWQSDRPRGRQDELYYKIYDGLTWFSDTQLTNDPADDTASSIAQINDRKIWVVWAADGDEDFDIYYKTTVPIPGDVNGDGTVDSTDLALVSEAYGTVEGDPDYNPAADLNYDGVIDTYDLAECGKNYG